MGLQPFVGPWPPFSFMIIYTVGRWPWTGYQSIARPLPTHRTTQMMKRGQTSVPWVGFERTMPVIERAKTVQCLRPRGHCDRSSLWPSIYKIKPENHFLLWLYIRFKFSLPLPLLFLPILLYFPPSFSIAHSHQHPAILVSVFHCFISPQVCYPGFLVVPCCFPFSEYVPTFLCFCISSQPQCLVYYIEFPISCYILFAMYSLYIQGHISFGREFLLISL
jgi:hypothetical protein